MLLGNISGVLLASTAASSGGVCGKNIARWYKMEGVSAVQRRGRTGYNSAVVASYMLLAEAKEIVPVSIEKNVEFTSMVGIWGCDPV